MDHGDQTGSNVWATLCGWLLMLLMPLTAASQDAEEQFPQPYDSETGFATPPMDPHEAAQSFKVPDGFRMTLFSAEPEIRQPIAIASDERGRLWVAENYTYAESQLNFDDNLRDRIVILEDTDGDGKADRRQVFWDQAQKLTSIEIGQDGIWALCAPNLLFLPDRDHDDVMDGEPVVVLDGWDGDAVRHNIANGLRWGPDGWLYGRHGILATSFVGRPGTAREHRTPINCAIWRYHPRRDVFEIVATGTTNPWGMDWDSEGELFFINTVIGHLWHAVPGSHFERMYGSDFNPHWYSLITQIADHVHWNTEEKWSDIRLEFTPETDRAGGGHAHIGLLIYQEDQWPEEYRGSVFTLNLHGRRLNRDRLERHGSSFKATHAPDFAFSNDAWFRGIDLITGPQGQVWIADWSDTGECHENDGVHRSSGRIYQLDFGQPAASARPDLKLSDTEQLAQHAVEGVEWYSRQARRLLVDRWHTMTGEDPKRQAAIDYLQSRLHEGSDSQSRLRSLWALYGLEVLTSEELLGLVNESDPAVRRWAVRLLSDQAIAEQRTVDGLIARANIETDGLVLMYLASSLNRLPIAQRWGLATALVKSELAATDPRFQKMVWFGLEPSIADQPQQVADWLHAPLPTDLIRWTARRLAVRQTEDPAALREALVATQGRLSREQADALLDGLATGLKGASQLAEPEGWLSWIQALPAELSPSSRLAIAELETLFGAGRGEEALLAIAKDGNEELAIRRQAILSLGRMRSETGRDLLLTYMTDRDLGDSALQGLRFLDLPQVAATIVERFDQLRPSHVPAAVTTLCARADSARRLLEAIEQGKIAREFVAAYEWRQLLSLDDAQVSAQVAKIWPESREWQDLAAQKERVRALISENKAASADLGHGAELFQKNCANCHRLLGQGAEIGPDLTGGQRDNLNYLIDNIVSPSAEVATSYRTSLFELSDGQVVVGVVLTQLTDRVVVQTKEGPQTLLRSDIENRVESGNSLMPDGLLNPLSDQEVIDLLTFLQQAGK